MNKNEKDSAVIGVLMERFQKRRLPRLLDIKEKVDQGNKLDQFDIEFLTTVFKDARENEHYLEEAGDEYKDLIAKVFSLYHSITEKALENEQK